MRLSDEALMLAVRDGDIVKLGDLFERYHAPLLDFFCRMNGNRIVSEDLVQDVFYRILKYRNTFREDNRFRTWLYRIAHNARLQHYKKHPTVESAADPRVESSNTRVERDPEVDLLRCAMAKLPEEPRELLVLVWHRELPYSEIAELLGIEVGAVKVRVHRAVKKLRELYLEVSNESALCNVKKFKITSRIS
jgi:RNA polymerase sigma-70 factor (ECF subfamily)